MHYDGRDLASLSEGQVSEYLFRDVGFIYQNYHLMPRVSAIENAAIKLMLGGVGMREAQARARPWLERVGLGERLRSTPEELSGGERQRVAIARALAGEPRLILADEPTGNLDSARSGEIVELLRSIAHERGATVVLVTHDAEAATAADRRYTLRDGKLHADDVDGPEQIRSRIPSTPRSARREHAERLRATPAKDPAAAPGAHLPLPQAPTRASRSGAARGARDRGRGRAGVRRVDRQRQRRGLGRRSGPRRGGVGEPTVARARPRRLGSGTARTRATPRRGQAGRTGA